MTKERIILIVGIVIAVGALLFFWQKDKFIKDEVPVPLWTPQIQNQQPVVDANKAAKEMRKKTVMFFTGPSCPPCERMKREVFPNTEVQKLMNNYVFQTVNVSDDVLTTKKFQVKVTPTLIMTDGDTIVKRQEGAMSVSQMVAWLQGDQNPSTQPKDDKKTDKPKDAPKQGLLDKLFHRNK